MGLEPEAEWTSRARLVEDRKQFEVVLYTASQAEYIVCDTETSDAYKGAKAKASYLSDGTNYCTGVGIGYEYLGSDWYYYLPWRHLDNNLPVEWLDEFKELLEDPNIPLIYHNAPYDIPSLATLGIDVLWNPFYCTLSLAQFVNEEFPSKELNWLAKYVLKDKGKDDDTIKVLLKALRWGEIPASVMWRYCLKDVRIAHQLFRVFWKEMG